MATNNSWNNQVTAAYNQIILNSGANGVAIGTDNATGAITIGTGTSGRTINIGLSAANNLLFLGTSNGTAATNIQAGSGGLILNSVAGTATLDATSGVSINSTAGALNLGDGANSFAVNIGTAGTRTVTMGSTTSTSSTSIDCGTGGANFGTSANVHATIIGSTTASCTTTIQAPSAGVILTGVQGVAVANKNYVTINTATGAIGSDAGPASSISITGDTGGALTGASFTFTGGTTGLSFGGSGTTETLTFAGITANGGTVSLATDATASTINVGTGAGAKTSTFGSVNTTSATTVQSGSGALNVTSTNGALTINSGTGTLAIGSDATGQTIGFATGAGAKLVTVGTTNGAASLALKYGTADFTLASATGTVMSALDTGEITYPLQPAFFAYLAASTANDKTGDSTVYTVPWDTEAFDQNGDFATNTFTAPVTGKYCFTTMIGSANLAVAHTTQQIDFFINGATGFPVNYLNPGVIKGGGNILYFTCSIFINLTAADTVVTRLTVVGSTKTVGVVGGLGGAYFCGYLVC